MIRLNLGCGPDIKRNYINVDGDTKEQIERRYAVKLDDDIVVSNYDIFNLPFEDSSVDEVLCKSAMEHFSFVEEKKFFYEVKRILKVGGKFIFTVPDFDFLFERWLKAEDNFVDFYKTSQEEHWFGQGNRNIDNKWGYLTAHVFGNQNGQYQFHKNAYTVKKVMKILNMLGFYYKIEFVNFKDTEIKFISCEALKY